MAGDLREERHEVRIQLRIKRSEKELWEALSRHLGLGISECVRAVMKEKAVAVFGVATPRANGNGRKKHKGKADR